MVAGSNPVYPPSDALFPFILALFFGIVLERMSDGELFFVHLSSFSG